MMTKPNIRLAESIFEVVCDMEKLYPNDQELGKKIRKLIKTIEKKQYNGK